MSAILDYLVEVRDVIRIGGETLAGVADGTRPRSDARNVHEGLRGAVKDARSLARAPEHRASRAALEGIVRELESLRADAKRLL